MAYQAVNYLSSLGQKHLVGHSREESNVHVACSDATPSAALTVIFLANSIYRKGHSLGLTRQLLRRVLGTSWISFKIFNNVPSNDCSEVVSSVRTYLPIAKMVV